MSFKIYTEELVAQQQAAQGYVTQILGVDTKGAQVLIEYGDGVFRHCSAVGITRPRVEVFTSGIRIGCTFVTATAVKKLALEMDAFIKANSSKVLQEGLS